MGMHQVEFADDDPLPDQFVEKFVAIWARHGLPPDDLAKAMLAVGVNGLIENSEPREVAQLLLGIACQISPPEVSGHA